MRAWITFSNVLRQEYSSGKFTQEVRLATPLTEHLDSLVGVFYTNETNKYVIQSLAIDAADGAEVGMPILWRDSLKFKEYAVFADLTARFTDEFDVQVGARSSHNSQTLHHREWTVFGGFLARDPESKEDAITYLITPRVQDHTRSDGLCACCQRLPPGRPECRVQRCRCACKYRPDKTINYEVGAKRRLPRPLPVLRCFGVSHRLERPAGHRDRCVRHLQLQRECEPCPQPGASSCGGGEAARRPDALGLGRLHRREAASGLFIVEHRVRPEGDRPPYSSRISGRFTATQALLARQWPRCPGRRLAHLCWAIVPASSFPSPALAPQRQRYPAYTQLDLNAGVRYDDWRERVRAERDR